MRTSWSSSTVVKEAAMTVPSRRDAAASQRRRLMFKAEVDGSLPTANVNTESSDKMHVHVNCQR